MAISIKITHEMKRKFHNETVENLERFEKMLMALEKDPSSKEAMHAAFRAIHSIKGNSDYIGVHDINQLSHELEELMDDVRSQNMQMTSHVFSVLYVGIDLLRKMNNNILSEDYKESDLSEILKAINKLKLISIGKEVPKSQNGFKRKPMDIMAVFVRSASQHLDQIKQSFEKMAQKKLTSKDKEHLHRILDTFHKSAAYVNALEIIQNITSIKACLQKDDMNDFCAIEKCIKKIEAILEEQLTQQQAKQGNENKKPDFEIKDEFSDVIGQEIRIDMEKLDTFMNQILSLFIEKNQLLRHLKIIDQYLQADFQIKSLGQNIQASIERISKLSDTLKKSVLKLRLLKMTTLFERLPAMVRKLSEQFDKKIELSISGHDIEVDRKVIEILIDPLIHLIRNSLDHGIEETSDRVANGKPETGKITISAVQEGNHVSITFSDDGKGLDIEKIRQIAIQKKILPQERLNTMNDNEIDNLIFVAGFSTSRKVTSISGRGVGLDIVNHNLKSIGGNVTMSYRKGEYTRFHLTVPINIAITEVLLAELNKEIYGFPFSAILETLWVFPREIKIINNQETISYRESILLIKSLGDIISFNQSTRLRTKNENEKIQVIVIAFGSQLLGVAVDRVITSEAVLNKPLGHHLGKITEFSSAATLGDGRIVLIINPGGIMKNLL